MSDPAQDTRWMMKGDVTCGVADEGVGRGPGVRPTKRPCRAGTLAHVRPLGRTLRYGRITNPHPSACGLPIGYNDTISPNRGAEVSLAGIVKALLALGPVGVLVLAAIDSAGIPLPDGVDALLILVGALNPSTAYLAAALAVIGSVGGNLVLFYLARKGGNAYLERKISSEKALKFRRWFQRYGLLTVFIPLLVPIPLPTKVFVLCAGALGVRPITFLLVILVARIPRYIGMAYLGSELGEHSMGYLRAHAWHLVGLAAGLFVVLYMLLKLHDRYRKPEPIL